MKSIATGVGYAGLPVKFFHWGGNGDWDRPDVVEVFNYLHKFGHGELAPMDDPPYTLGGMNNDLFVAAIEGYDQPRRRRQRP